MGGEQSGDQAVVRAPGPRLLDPQEGTSGGILPVLPKHAKVAVHGVALQGRGEDRKRVKNPPKKVVDPGSPEGGIAGEEERDPTRSPGDIARGTYGSTYSTGDE